jgi:hypothetical protein
LVAWRRVRRSARVKSLAPDGRIEVIADGGVAVALEEPPPR